MPQVKGQVKAKLLIDTIVEDGEQAAKYTLCDDFIVTRSQLQFNVRVVSMSCRVNVVSMSLTRRVSAQNGWRKEADWHREATFGYRSGGYRAAPRPSEWITV